MIEVTQDYVVYQGQTRLLQLAVEIAQSRSVIKPEIKAKIQNATELRLWLEALNYESYLTREAREKIWYALMDIGNLNDIPYAPTLTTNEPPSILVGIPGPTGATGATGATGGGIAFSASNVAVDTVVDSFDITLTGSAQWQYEITDGTNKRVETLTGTWLPDGSQFVDDGGITLDPEIGDTSDVTFAINISGSTVQLIASVTGGTWNISGSRILIPVTGNGITQPTSLADGKIWIGNSSNQPTAQTISGDVTVSNAGVAAIASGVIVNADVSASAALTVSKLAAMTASRAVVSDGSGFISPSSVTATELGYVSGATSNIQAQINAIAGAGTITGAITTYVTSNATADRVVVSNPAGKLTTSLTTSTELAYLQGVSSNIQTQINSEASTRSSADSNLQSQINSRVNSIGTTLNVKVVQIGDWNMNYSASGSQTKSVAHGLSNHKKIRGISVIVRDDADSGYYSLQIPDFFTGTVLAGVRSIDSTNINLSQMTSFTAFDSALFDATSYNRGWITITYES